MNAKIIIHSCTENTLSVAERLKETLLKQGLGASIERVTAKDEKQAQQTGTAQLKDIPGTGDGDAFVFAAPVHGFSLSAAMRAYLSQVDSLGGKKACVFVTQHFPFAWMGGNHAANQLKSLCEAKGAKICQTGVINWSSKKREAQIALLCGSFGEALK